jgi:electron-transferring-flavoprotein dehydrogenase
MVRARARSEDGEVSERESMPYDVVIVGAGPAGLSAAIRLKQLSPEIAVCVLEKGSEVGAHILSGAVVDPKALDELLPDWRTDGSCLMNQVPVTSNHHWVLTAKKKYNLPHLMMPSYMDNKGTFTGSLGNLCRWLAEQAEGLGVEIFPGFAAAEVLFHEDGSVKGVATGDMGVARDGTRKPDYTPGLELHAKYTLFAEGARGHLTKEVKKLFDLERDCQPQVYGIGIKELWDIDPAKHEPGKVIHTQGWPLQEAWGGGWIYHQANNQLSIGFVVALSYKNPHISPFDEMQRWKHHPEIKRLLEGGKRVSYGARAINEGGWQSVPHLVFPGGALIGCSAGFVNVPRIKGSHTAMKSGMLAAEAIVPALAAGRAGDTLQDYETTLRSSWIADELKKVRNVEPAVAKFGATVGTMVAGADMWMRQLRIGLPYTFRHTPDHEQLLRKEHAHPINYPKPDGVISFDKLSSVFLSNTNHEEDQPIHLTLKDADIPTHVNLPIYDGPEQRYCPAGVYEYVEDAATDTGMRLQINAQNCVHCKTCDIKDPRQNIKWVVPEGGGGPNYPNM